MNYKNFIKGIKIIKENFKGYEINRDLYWVMLKDIEDKKWEKIILEIVGTKPEIYPGTNLIAVIRQMVNVSNNNYPLEGEAYREACRIAFEYNPYKNMNGGDLNWNNGFKCSHPLIEKAIELIGLKELANSNEGDSAMRAHFTQIYRSLVERDKRQKLFEPIKSLESKNIIDQLDWKDKRIEEQDG